MSGKKPASHGVFFNYNTHLEGPTLPGVLADNGYHCHLSGKLHLWPLRKLYGFHSMDLADGPGDQGNIQTNDHSRYLARHGHYFEDAGRAHGITGNSWHARPWHLPEDTHPTYWCVSQAIEFLERRDPTRPFFLNVGIFHPHPPCTPPEFYYNRYINMDLPAPVEAEWSRIYERARHDFPLDMCGTSRLKIPDAAMRQLRAAYFASIAYIDDQIQRLLQNIPDDTLIIFTSDHGEMLGDHQYFGKIVPYEPSARIPLIMRFPESMGLPKGQVIDEPVELMDLMPTMLDAAGMDIPDSVDGESLVGLLRGESLDREYIHGECARVPGMGSGMQYLTNGREKYVWWPGQGEEQLFDLAQDPAETRDISDDYVLRDRVELWRKRLAHELEGRPEGFVKEGVLQKLDGPTPYCLPEVECEDSPGPTMHPDDPPPGFNSAPKIKKGK
jgi:arylsulfatase A-like enzyme